jgi:cytochrome P450
MTEKGEKFGEAFQYVTEVMGLQTRVGKLATIMPDRRFTVDKDFVNAYVSNYVQKAIHQNKMFAKSGTDMHEAGKYVYLDELSKKGGYTSKRIQDELLNILLAGRDTTASLLAHLWYILARRPDVFNKLREEVLSLGTAKPSFEQLKEMKYLQYCMNEGIDPPPPVFCFD